jgi:hypothetical protein
MAVPSTLTDAYGALLTTTLRAMEPTLRDNITRSNKFLSWLQAKGRMRSQDGGERVKVPLMYGLNSTADVYSGYGLLDTTPQDGITAAFFTWAQLAVSITISRLEERQNSGKSAALSLLQSKTTQSMNSLKELANNCIVAGKITSGASSATGQFSARTGRLDSGSSAMLPLAAIIDADDDRSVSIGNINGNTYSFWRNQSSNASSVTTFAGYKNALNHLYNNCSRGVMGAPDLLLGTQVAWEQYWNALTNQERYIITNPKTVDILGGSEALAFRNAAFVWDETVPDVGTNGTLLDGGIGLSSGELQKDTVFLINSETMEWIYDSQTNFITTPLVRPENQDARTGQILFMGVTGVNNRRKNGVLYNVQHTAFTS